ncbi:DUF5677 domain-containing protein [Aliarcobacter butzleri]
MLYEKEKKEIEKEILKNLSHINQIDEIKSIFLKFKKILENFDIDKSKELPYEIQKIQIYVLSNGLTHILDAIILLLKTNLFTPTDPLARVALEHSINILYILESKDHKHSKQFIKNYIDETLKASKNWYDYELRQTNQIGIQISKEKLENFKFLKNSYPDLYDDSCGDWPKAWERFQKCGHEAAYRTLYCMNSDSIHNFAEDTYNFMLVNNFPFELQKIVTEHFKSIQVSMSIYHGIKSLQYYGLVIKKISFKIKSKRDEKLINKLNKEVGKLIYIHESDLINKF